MEEKASVTLPHKVTGLPVHKDTPVIVFMPGFPDDYNSFESLASKYRASHSVRPN
jgi:hypothetical protein